MVLHGSTRKDQALYKIEEMRTELREISNRLNMIEGQLRRNTNPSLMSPNFSKLFWWHLSLMESYYAMVSALFGLDKMEETIRDFQGRFVR